jgi:hypothetical protein
LAKAKTKTAVKAKAAKAPARKAAVKSAVAKPAARKALKPSKPVVSRTTVPKKAAPVKLAKAPTKIITVAKAAEVARPEAAGTTTIVKPAAKASAPLKLVDPPKPVPAPARHRAAPPAAGAQPRADIPPAAGFVLMVDGHFKNQFETLKSAKDAAHELHARFPMLRLEIYDAVKKARLKV